MKFFDFNKVEYDAVIEKDIDREKKTMTMIVTKLNFQRNISTDFIILIYFHEVTEKLFFMFKKEPLFLVYRDSSKHFI